jgi:hypothetical protein
VRLNDQRSYNAARKLIEGAAVHGVRQTGLD